MNKRSDIIGKHLAAALCVVLSASCSAIDEDLSDCGNNYQLNYEIRLVTNMSIELRTQLNTTTDVGIAEALRGHLQTIFTDHANDVDLSFYDTQGDQPRLQHDQHIMDANQQSYTLYLPMRQYQHLAVANVVDNSVVSLLQDDNCRTAKLEQVEQDTIDSHTTGLFTARQPMNVLSGVDQTFNVRLFMANCAVALVVDPREQDVSNIRVFSTGFASQFNINDSTYHFAAKPPLVRATELRDAIGGQQRCYCTVNFPSRVPYNIIEDTRSIIETTEPFIAQPGEETLWQFIVYVTLKNGKTTQTVLSIRKSVGAGQLMIVKGYVTEDGAVHAQDQTVGVSVTLDWNEGGIYNPEL